MGKAIGKRLPHGTTKLKVLYALMRLHRKDGRRWKVSRADLMKSLDLPETTVDDRLRTLVKEGLVSRVGRGTYVPKP